MPGFHSINPCFVVPDVGAALRWYETELGFSGDPFPESEPFVFAILRRVVADGPPGTVPDVQGLSARDAMRKLVKVGLAAHLAGDGFVASQDPPAGAPLEAGTVRLVLSRWSARPVNLTNSANPATPVNSLNRQAGFVAS